MAILNCTHCGAENDSLQNWGYCAVCKIALPAPKLPPASSQVPSRTFDETPFPQSMPSLTGLIQELGGRTEVFRPSAANLIAGMIIGMLLIAGGLALAGGSLYLLLSPKGSDWQTTILGIGMGTVLMTSGVLFIYLMKRMFSYCLVVCAEGFIRQVGKRTDCCRWDDIASVVEEVKSDHLPLKGAAKYAVPLGKSRSYTIHRKDGTEFLFTADTIKRLGRFATMVREATDHRGIPWLVDS